MKEYEIQHLNYYQFEEMKNWLIKSMTGKWSLSRSDEIIDKICNKNRFFKTWAYCEIWNNEDVMLFELRYDLECFVED